jgi:hypothetical protein
MHVLHQWIHKKILFKDIKFDPRAIKKNKLALYLQNK